MATAIVLATLDNLDLLAFFQATYKYNWDNIDNL